MVTNLNRPDISLRLPARPEISHLHEKVMPSLDLLNNSANWSLMPKNLTGPTDDDEPTNMNNGRQPASF